MLATERDTELQSRIEWWRRQISRQQSTGVSVAEFCRQRGITARMFYYWKGRVREAQGTKSNPRITAGGSPRSATTAAGGGAASFVPVSILHPTMTTELEIELANACVVRLRGSIDPSLLQAAIAAAGQVDPRREGAD
jgi:hypothetical protein